MSTFPHSMISLIAQIQRQDDVLKSISQNVSGGGGDGGGRIFLAVLVGALGILLLVAFLSRREKRAASPRALNHPGKLLKEVMRQVPLKPAEMKQLKILVQGERDAGKPVSNPLVLLLCPSALVDATRAQRVKVDRKVLAGVAKKLGLVGPPPKQKA